MKYEIQLEGRNDNNEIVLVDIELEAEVLDPIKVEQVIDRALDVMNENPQDIYNDPTLLDLADSFDYMRVKAETTTFYFYYEVSPTLGTLTYTQDGENKIQWGVKAQDGKFLKEVTTYEEMF